MSFPRVIDNSMLSDFRTCPRKFAYRWLEHWAPAEVDFNLLAGAAFAAGLEAARLAYWQEGKSPEVAVAEGLRALWTVYGPREPANGRKDPLATAAALVYYFDVWPLHEDPAEPLALPSGQRAIEYNFVEPLDLEHPGEVDEPLLYTGRIDLLVTLNGAVFVEDDKTTSDIKSSWADQWDLWSQFTGYVWAARRAQFSSPAGVIVRGVSIRKTGPRHAQYITYRADWEIERWYEQLLRDVRRMIAAYHEDYWDFVLGYQCQFCPFRQVCKSPEPREWLEAYFVRRKWDPLTRTETLL